MKVPKEVEDKVYSAETHVAAVRLAVIVLNVLVFLFLLPREATIPWLGYTISVVASVYALFVVLLHPERHLPVMQTSLFTSITDAALITLWILATGGYASPFYVLWYVSIAAIALRYDARTTVVTAVAYAGAYVALLLTLGSVRPEHTAGIVVRSVYILFVAVLGGWLAHETLNASRARSTVARLAEELDREVQVQTGALRAREKDLQHSLEELERANVRLKELDRLKSVFLNTTAHELRTPLTSLKLQLHLLKTAKLGSLNDKQRRATELIDRNMQRLALLVQDVSDAARLQGGHFTITPEPVELRAVVEEVVETIHEPARQHSVALVVSAPDELWVRGDANRLTQVLFNLMSNAIKFTPDGGRVSLVAEVVGDEAQISVRDTGPGLTTPQMEQLFQPFTQVHDMMETTEPGTGLGLFIAKGIVEHHGGRIWCESDGHGRGAVFRFTVPLHRSPRHAAGPVPDVPKGSGASHGRLAGA